MIYYKVSGKGIPVVLLHGYGEDHTLWESLSKVLAPSYRVIAPDLPGFGNSTRINGNFSLEDVAREVFSFLTLELGLTTFFVFGHSLGGYVSLALAEGHAQHILGLGLINSTALADSPEKKENREKTAQFIRKHSASFFLNNFVPNLFYEANREKLANAIEQVKTMGRNLDEELLADYMLAMKKRPARLSILSKFEHVLFIGGAMDGGFTLADFEKQIKELRNQSNGHILPDTGHMSMYEAAGELETIIINFLKSI